MTDFFLGMSVFDSVPLNLLLSERVYVEISSFNQ